MANQYSMYTYDEATKVRPAGAAITATETCATILDLGAGGILEADLVVDVAAIDTVTGDEVYTIILEGSPDAAFGTATNITVLAMQKLGGATGAAPLGTADGIGRFVIPFRNERNGILYRYARLYTVIAGTTPSITFKAFLGKDK
jgi:hypothetical protein